MHIHLIESDLKNDLFRQGMPDIKVVDRRTIENRIVASLPYNLRSIGYVEGMACAVARIHSMDFPFLSPDTNVRRAPFLSSCGEGEILFPVIEVYAQPEKTDPLYGFDVHLDPEADEQWNDSKKSLGPFTDIVHGLHAVLRDMSQHYFGAAIEPHFYTLSGTEQQESSISRVGPQHLSEAIENLRVRALANPALRKGLAEEYLDRPQDFEQLILWIGNAFNRRGLNQKEQDYFSQLFGQEP